LSVGENPDFKFWRLLQWKMLINVGISLSFGLIYCHFVAIWYIFPRFVMLHQEISGSPDQEPILRSWVPTPAF
jgi:uncharacterized membrane protein